MKYLLPLLLAITFTLCILEGCTGKDSNDSADTYQIDGTYLFDAELRSFLGEEELPDSPRIFNNLQVIADQRGNAVTFWGVLAIVDTHGLSFNSEFSGLYTHNIYDHWIQYNSGGGNLEEGIQLNVDVFFLPINSEDNTLHARREWTFTDPERIFD